MAKAEMQKVRETKTVSRRGGGVSMKGGMGTGLVIIGFIFLWMAISGRLDCFYQFVACMVSGQPGADPSSVGQTKSSTSGMLPALPKLPILT